MYIKHIYLTRDSYAFADPASTLDEVTSGVKSQHLHTQHDGQVDVEGVRVVVVVIIEIKIPCDVLMF